MYRRPLVGAVRWFAAEVETDAATAPSTARTGGSSAGPVRLIAALAVTSALCVGGCGSGPDDPVATTSHGVLRGTRSAGVEVFRGVRFARPPVGNLRFRAPRPPARWSGVRDAVRNGSRCPQELPSAPGRRSRDEDCLFLNVTRPETDGPHPVMVWLHGGSGLNGAGSDYDARRLARQGGVVVVTPNYRLGSLGLLAMPGLRDGGTFALADQIAALRWARSNARAFGGDPRNVTVLGQSQGAFTTCALLTTPAARGLFAKAAMASGSCEIDFPANGFAPGQPALRVYASRARAERTGRRLAKAVGCVDVACMRRAPVGMLLDPSFLPAYAYGTRLLPEDPRRALRRGDVARVPVISGGTRDEANSLIGAAGVPIDRARRAALLRQSFDARAAAVERRYPPVPSPLASFARIMTDRAWACPTLVGNRLLARRTTVYAYEFADPDAPNVGQARGLDPGAAHACDVPYLFDIDGKPLKKDERLASRMVGYWSRFARTGDPNGRGAPRWAPFTGGSTVLELRPGRSEPVDVGATHRCGFWAGVRDRNDAGRRRP